MSHRRILVEDISDNIMSKKMRNQKEERINKNKKPIRTPEGSHLSIIDAMNNSGQDNKEKESNKVIEIRTIEEYEKFKKKYNRSVVFYGAEWCHSCKEIEDLYSRIAKRYCKRVAMAHVDIDVANLDFTHVPVFVALRNGKQIDSIVGAERASLKELIKKAITTE